MSELSGQKQGGTLEVDGQPIFGELTVDGPNTQLHLRDEKFIADHRIRHGCILGRLLDLKKVSLFGCLTMSNGNATRLDQGYSTGRTHACPLLLLVTRLPIVTTDS